MRAGPGKPPDRESALCHCATRVERRGEADYDERVTTPTTSRSNAWALTRQKHDPGRSLSSPPGRVSG